MSADTRRRPVRVLQVIDSLPPGGAEQLVVSTARHLDRDRFEIHVCGLQPTGSDSPVVRSLDTLGVPIHRARGRRPHDPFHAVEVLRIIRDHQIDIVHGHLPYAISMSAPASALSRRPLVATVHSTAEFRRGRSVLTDAAKGFVLRTFPRRVIACAPVVRDEVLGPLGVPARRVRLLPNAIDVDAFKSPGCPVDVQEVRRSLLAGRGGPLVLSVGSTTRAKAHHRMVEALPALVARHPEVALAIVGRPGDNQAHVRDRIAGLGMEGHVNLAGARGDLPAVLAASDVFVLPSDREGLPLALLEAMAAGTPVVATAVGGVPAVVEDGVTGRLVRPGDGAGLATAILDVLGEPDVAREGAARAREQVRARYDIGPWVAGLEALYLELLPWAAH
jgi:glycosyltransferase involved in cell wall biosynthesis